MEIETLNSSMKSSIEVAKRTNCSKANNKEGNLSNTTRSLSKQRPEMLQKHPRQDTQLRQMNLRQ